MSDVVNLASVQGLMTIVPILDWKKGILSLINSAEAQGIIPNAIALTRLTEEDSEVTFSLYGEK